MLILNAPKSLVINHPYGSPAILVLFAVYHMKKYDLYPISLKLFSYKPKRNDVILNDKIKVDGPWKKDLSEEVVDNTNS